MTEERTPYLPMSPAPAAIECDTLLFGAAPSPLYAPIPMTVARGAALTICIDNNEHIVFVSRTATGAFVEAIDLPPDVVLCRRIGGRRRGDDGRRRGDDGASQHTE